MEALENEMKPSESLQLIMQVIGKTKENIKEHGYLFLLWGWLIASASILFFLLHTFTTFKWYFLPFPVLSTIGIILTIVYYSRRSRSAETYLGYYLKKLWLVLGVSFIVVVFINVVKGNLPFTYTMLIGGIGTLVSGLVLRFRPLTIGGIIFLAFTVMSIFIVADYAPLLQGFAVIAGYLIPGYILKYSKD